MTTKRMVTLECDYPSRVVNGSIHDSDPTTHTFSLDGEAMEVDLCDKHWGMFTRAMSQFTVNARRVETPTPRAVVTIDGQPMGSVASSIVRRRGRPLGSKNGTRTPPALSDAAKVRTWAKSRGFKVSERGRISSSITTAYAEANA